MPTLLDRLSLYRIVFVSTVFGLSAFLTGAVSDWKLSLSLIGLLVVVVVEVVLGLAYLLAIYKFPQLRLNKAFLAIQYIIDAVVLAVPIVVGAGTASPFTTLYVVLILVAALTHSFRFALTMSLLCCCLVAAIGYLEVNGLLPGIKAPGRIELIREILLRDLVYFGMFFVLGLLPARAMERARETDEQLVDLHRDYLLAQELNRLVVDQVPSGMALLDEKGRLILLNQAGQRLLAKAGIDNRQVWLQSIARHPDGFSQEIDFETGGHVATLAFTVADLQTGAIEAGKLIIFQDITQRKRIEASLEQERRLGAIGQLSANLAHEIRNPLAAISNSLQILSSQPEADEKTKRLLAIQDQEIRRLERLVSDFLQFARPNAPRLKRVAARTCIDLVVDRVKLDPSAKACKIELSGLDDLPDVQVDIELFTQAFGNLIINAVQWAPAGSVVRVRGAADDAYVYFEVENAGEAIPESVRRNLFEPFTSGRPGGTGLGLSIAWSAVQSMGGKLTLLVSEKEHTVFMLAVPVFSAVADAGSGKTV